MFDDVTQLQGVGGDNAFPQRERERGGGGVGVKVAGVHREAPTIARTPGVATGPPLPAGAGHRGASAPARVSGLSLVRRAGEGLWSLL